MVENSRQHESDQQPPFSENRCVEIVPYAPGYRDEFRRLNVEWLDKYFRVEVVDNRILRNPEIEIIDRGGSIYFARIDSRIVGTVALINSGKGRYELSKMSVTRAYQGHGIGRKLARKAILRFEEIGGRELYLESNSRLKPALALYESMGFVHEPVPGKSEYERADVYMVYRPRKS